VKHIALTASRTIAPTSLAPPLLGLHEGGMKLEFARAAGSRRSTGSSSRDDIFNLISF
jgi:hypothetical protein